MNAFPRIKEYCASFHIRTSCTTGLLGIKNKKNERKNPHKMGINMGNTQTLFFQQSHKCRVFISRHGNDNNNKTTETLKHS